MTKLEKELVRETSIEKNGRNLILHIHPEKGIGFRFKGLSKEAFFIGIKDLYELVISLDNREIKTQDTPNGELDIARVQSDLEKADMPWPYKSALRKFLRRNYT